MLIYLGTHVGENEIYVCGCRTIVFACFLKKVHHLDFKVFTSILFSTQINIFKASLHLQHIGVDPEYFLNTSQENMLKPMKQVRLPSPVTILCVIIAFLKYFSFSFTTLHICQRKQVTLFYNRKEIQTHSPSITFSSPVQCTFCCVNLRLTMLTGGFLAFFMKNRDSVVS